jgi:hypothetical protein
MRSLIVGLLIAPVLLLSTSVPPLSGQARKPLLSEAIRTTLEKEGIEAAERRYAEIARGQRDDYEFDLNGLAELAGTYMQRGDTATGMALLEIAADAAAVVTGYTQEMVQSRPPPASADRQPQRDPAVPMDELARRRGLALLGPGREDLDRFDGVYGDPAAQGGRTEPHNYFVMSSCEGHLSFGGMWGGLAPWSLKSLSDAEFAQPQVEEGQPAALRVVFHLGAGRRATALTHNMIEAWGGSGSPTARVERLGDLSPEWVPRCDG